MLVSKNAKNVPYPQCEFKNVRHPTQNPNVSQWNIGYVGFQTRISCIGHVHFMFFVLISFVLGNQRKHSFQWNMSLKFQGNGYNFCTFNITEWDNILT